MTDRQNPIKLRFPADFEIEAGTSGGHTLLSRTKVVKCKIGAAKGALKYSGGFKRNEQKDTERNH